MLKSKKFCHREDPDLGDGPFPLRFVGKTPGRYGWSYYLNFFMDRERTNMARFVNQKWGEHHDVPGISLSLGAEPLTARLVTLLPLLLYYERSIYIYIYVTYIYNIYKDLQGWMILQET